MNKIIPIVIGVVIVAVIVGVFYFYEELKPEIVEPEMVEKPWNWSGPFAIKKNQYKLGEKIFINIRGLQPDDVGRFQFYLPDGKPWVGFPFNGTEKSSFKRYFEPDTSRFQGIYEPEQLVGNWTITFNGTFYAPIKFEIINEFEPGEEDDIVSIPRG